MIYLDINTTKVVAISSKPYNILNPYYIWKIKDSDTNLEYIFTADNTSVAPYNYNSFNFTVIPGATYGATQGVISANQGVYSYCVYISDTQYSLNIIENNKVTNGILNILGAEQIVKSFTASNNNIIPTFKL